MKRYTMVAALVLACVAAPARAQDDTVKALVGKLLEGDDKAADALVALGGRAAPGLTKAMKQASNQSDGGPAWAAATALSRIGAPAVPSLRDYLKDTEGNPVFALSALVKMGGDARPALPEVVALVKKGPGATGNFGATAAYPLAVDVLGLAGGADVKEVVPLLVSQLTPKNPYAAHIIVALGRMGSAARAAVPALTEVEKEGPPALRPHAKNSLRLIKGS